MRSPAVCIFSLLALGLAMLVSAPLCPAQDTAWETGGPRDAAPSDDDLLRAPSDVAPVEIANPPLLLAPPAPPAAGPSQPAAAPSPVVVNARPRWIVTGTARFSFIQDGKAAEGFAGYRDLWNTGLGGSAEIFHDQLSDGRWQLGPYGSIGADAFHGGEHLGNDPVLGTVHVRAEDLVIVTGLLGLEMRSQEDEGGDGIFWGVRAGGGIARYLQTDANLTFTVIPGITGNSRSTLYEGSTTWALEAQGRIGYRYGDWSAFFGGGLRLTGEPEAGSRLHPDPDTLFTVPIEFGVEFRF